MLAVAADPHNLVAVDVDEDAAHRRADATEASDRPSVGVHAGGFSCMIVACIQSWR
jgi:hypothetical protein